MTDSNLEHQPRPIDKIFPNRLKEIKEKRCPSPPIGCGKPIGKLRDELSFREYMISGLCQECQDIVFAEPEETEDDIDPNYGDPKD